MDLLDKLLGRRKRTSETISSELATYAASLTEARNRAGNAKTAREAALDQLDKAGMKAAEEAQANAKRDVALVERAIMTLQAALEEQNALEERESFLNEVTDYQADANELASWVENNYPVLAAEIGANLANLQTLGASPPT